MAPLASLTGPRNATKATSVTPVIVLGMIATKIELPSMTLDSMRAAAKYVKEVVSLTIASSLSSPTDQFG